MKTQIKHLTLHNNHPDKTIVNEIVEILQQRTQSTILYKVRAHANIEGNKKVDTLVEKLSFVPVLCHIGRVIQNIHVTLDHFPVTFSWLSSNFV